MAAQQQGRKIDVAAGSIEDFDPSNYLTKVSGRDYLEVKWRLVWLRKVDPEATITTELIEHDRQAKWSLTKATVTRTSGASATGYGHGAPTQSISDYIEKGETKAIGRALLALGFGTAFAGFDLAEDPNEPADSPVDMTAARGRQVAATDDGKHPTVEAHKQLMALVKGAASLADLEGHVATTIKESGHGDNNELRDAFRRRRKALQDAQAGDGAAQAAG